jgi:hypothetical protein
VFHEQFHDLFHELFHHVDAALRASPFHPSVRLAVRAV